MILLLLPTLSYEATAGWAPSELKWWPEKEKGKDLTQEEGRRVPQQKSKWSSMDAPGPQAWREGGHGGSGRPGPCTGYPGEEEGGRLA